MAIAPSEKLPSTFSTPVTGAQPKPPAKSDPMLDYSTIQQTMREAMAQTEAARQKVQPVIAAALESARTADQQFQRTIQIQTDKADAAIAKGRGAYKNLQDLGRWPTGVANFIGMFDPDFSAKRQQAILGESELDLQSTAIKTRQAVSTHDIAIQSAGRVSTAAKEFYQFSRQGFLDAASFAQLGFAVKAGIREEMVNKLTDASDADLKKWGAKTPPDLMGHEGLIDLEVYRRRLQDANLNSVQMSNAMQQAKLQEVAAQQFVDQFNSTSEAEQALKAGDLPPNVAPGMVQRKIAEAKGVSINLEAAAEALKVGKAQNAEYFKGLAFAGMQSSDISALIETAKASGQSFVETKDGLKLSVAELKVALSKRQAFDREQETLQADIYTTLAETESNRLSALSMADKMQSFLNPDNPDAPLPEEYQAEIQKALGTEAIAERLGTVGAAQLSAQTWEATAKRFREMQEEVVKGQVIKDNQPAVREWFNTGGRINTATNAAVLLWNEAPNTAAMGNTRTLKEGWALLGPKLQEITTGKSLGVQTNADGSFTLTGVNEDEAASLINRAVNESGFREVTRGNQFQFVLHTTAGQLASQKIPQIPHQKTPLAEIFSQIVNPETGTFSRSFMQTDPETGASQFDMGMFHQQLARLEVQAHENGVIPPDQSLIQVLYSKMFDNLGIVAQDFNNPTAAALNKIVYNNNPSQDVADYIRQMAMSTQQEQINQQRVLDNQKMILNETLKATGTGLDRPLGP